HTRVVCCPHAAIYTVFPYTTLFRSYSRRPVTKLSDTSAVIMMFRITCLFGSLLWPSERFGPATLGRNSANYSCGRDLRLCTSTRSEEHTSELQSRVDLVCRLMLEKK